MNVLTIFGIFVATTTVMLLCMRFGMAMTNTTIHNGTDYHATDGGPIDHNRDKVLLVTIQPYVATAEVNETDNSTSRDRRTDRTSIPVSTTSRVAKKPAQTNNNHSSEKHLQQMNSRSLTNTGQADIFSKGPLTSDSGLPRPIDPQGTSISIDLHNRHDFIMNVNDEDVTGGANMYPIKSRQISERKINHQLNTNTGKYAKVAEDDIPAGYQNAYDLTYNVGNNGYQEYDIPAYGTVWNSDGRPEQSHPGSSWSGSSGSWEPPPYGLGEGYLTGQGPAGRQPSDHPSTSTPTKNDQNQLQPVTLHNSIDWKTFGALALFKLGLAKLQAIGFLNTLFLLGFSFKLFMIAMFFKFMLILKLIKFFKVLLIPLYLIRLLPSLIQLLLMPGRMLDLLRQSTNNNYDNMPMQSSPSMGPAQSSQSPGGLLPSQSSGGSMSSQSSGGSMSSQSSGGLLPSRPGGLLPGRPGDTQRGGLVRAMDDGIPTSANDPHFKLDDDKNLTTVRNHESVQLSDSILNIFQKLMDSEKCVERIACRVSVAEKTGTVPVWINWLLHHVHELIPNDKLELYLKAYKNVHKQIHTMSSVPDSWVTWCSERYDCDSDNATNAKQF